MFMSRLVLLPFFISAAVLALSGCQSADPTLVTADAPDSADPVPVIATQIAPGRQFIARYMQLSLDPDLLSAEISHKRQTSAQPPQAIYYDFDIANFLNSESFLVTGVSLDEFGDFVLDFTHAHPFPAPDVETPISGINRADLGYTGRLLVLSTGAPELFFDGSVRLDPRIVKDADGYVNPGDLLESDSFNLANTFPYVLLADEGEDNRVGISNGGDPEGSYSADFAGWQRTNLGPEGTGWTGYDYVHGGQTIQNQLTLQREALENNNYLVDLAFLIKYTDPRGAGGLSNRIPAEIIAAEDFAYRLPFAALDNSKITITEPLDSSVLCCGTDRLEVAIRDWDTRATEAGDSDLSDESNVALVQPGASGIPAVRLDAPDFLNEPVALTGLRGSGLIGDEMEFGADITPDGFPGSGDYFGLLEVVDRENLLDRGSYHFGVDPDSVLPDSTRALPVVTYQSIPISEPLRVLSVQPTGTFYIGDEVTFSAEIVGGEPDNYSWNFSGGTDPFGSGDPRPTVRFTAPVSSRTGSLTLFRGGENTEPFEFTYQVLPRPVPTFFNHVFFSNDFASSGASPQIAQGDGVLAVAYPSSAFDGIVMGVSNSEFPGFNGNWDVFLVDPGTGRAGFLQLAVLRGRPVMTYNTETTDNFAFTYATTDMPQSASDFATYDIVDSADSTGYFGSLQAINDRLIAAHHNGSTQDVMIAYSMPDQGIPTRASEWTSYSLPTIDLDGEDLEIVGQTSGEGGMILAYRNVSDADRDIRVATSNTPEAADWQNPYTLESGRGEFSMALAGNTPHAVFRQESGERLRYFKGRTFIPINSSSWDDLDVYYETDGPIGVPDIAIIEGRPAIAFDQELGTGFNVVKVLRAVDFNPFELGDWQEASVYQPGFAATLTEKEDLLFLIHSRQESNDLPVVSKTIAPW